MAGDGADSVAEVAAAVDYRCRPVSRASTGGWKWASFIIGKCSLCSSCEYVRVLDFLTQWMHMCSGGDRGAVRVLRSVREPDHLPHGAAGRGRREGGGGPQRVDRHGSAAAAAGWVARGQVPRPLPDHRARLAHLHPRTYKQNTQPDNHFPLFYWRNSVYKTAHTNRCLTKNCAMNHQTATVWNSDIQR
jgi:hypothetical protein